MPERAPRGQATFRQRDVAAAIRAARKAGEVVGAVEISRDGTIRIIVGADAVPRPEKNEWDED